MKNQLLMSILSLALVAAVGCKDNKKPDDTPSTANAAENSETNNETTGAADGAAAETVAEEPAEEPAEQTWQAKFETTEGDFTVEVHPSWAPNGAKRFRELVEADYYTDIAAFRVIDNFMAQFGIHGDPAMNKKWRENRIPDDPRNPDVSNTRGRVTFAMAGPNTRTTQLFINFRDNSMLDSQGFTPIGEVVGDGMTVVDKLYKGYGEGAPRGKGPDQGELQAKGNEYLKKEFPKLSYIKSVTIVGDDAQEGGSGAAAGNDDSGKPADAAPAKAWEAGAYTDSAVKGSGLEGVELRLALKADGSVTGNVKGKREGKGFSIPVTGKITDDGALTASGNKGSAELTVRAKAKDGTIAGAIQGKINDKGARATFKATQ